ncbi:MAG: FMN-binding protein [Clostridia bacterium]|nr:FMN-binding protein [Clostridia bacterium]
MPVAALLLAAAVLLGVYNLTLDLRAENQAKELQAKMETLLPGSTTFTEEEYTGEDDIIAVVYKGENGYVIGTVTAGYAGPIHMLIGVSDDGYVTGLQVRRMEETFGLGAEALSDWEFLAQFLRTEGDVAVGVEIDSISGTTVTSKAITRSVNAAVAYVTGSDVDSGATSWGG